MEVEIKEVEGGSLIKVLESDFTALIVRNGDSERIYLPGNTSQDSTYYVSGNRETEAYEFFHPGEIEDFEVLRTDS